MAEVHIVDIDGEQWDIKDSPLTARVATLEDKVSTKDEQDIVINMLPGYTASVNHIFNHYSVNKIHFMTVRISNLKGADIGTAATIYLGSTNMRPKKDTSFILCDYIHNVALRCFLNIDGKIAIGGSEGVTSGNNLLIGELIFAEP